MHLRYSAHFVGKTRAITYQEQYAPGGYADLLWQIEKQFLVDFMKSFTNTHKHVDYLDFATGAGRILLFLEPMVGLATGIDTSEDMLALARTRSKKARLLRMDITTQAHLKSADRYDLITAFRFILNADPGLRRDAMCALASRLKDRSSALIFNNHGNPFSHKLFMLPFHIARKLGGQANACGNYITHLNVVALVAEAGLVIEDVFGYGFFSDKVRRLVGFRTALRLERMCAGIPFLQMMGVNQIYVVRLREEKTMNCGMPAG